MTPESFFRMCDMDNARLIQVADFRKQIQSVKLVIPRRTVDRLVAALDANLDGVITMEEFYAALYAYDCADDRGALQPQE